MSSHNLHRDMIKKVAEALGEELRAEMAFVGGSTTGLLLTDPVVSDEVRYTHDVDLIVNVVGYPGWEKLRQKLSDQGFRASMEEDVICRLKLGELAVDFMPDDPQVMGFSNLWYKRALAAAEPYQLDDTVTIRLLTSPFFLATKFEAWKGRGGNDVFSKDMEDIMNLVNGREEIVGEVANSESELQKYIAQEVGALIKHRDYEILLQDATRGDDDREDVLAQRLEELAGVTC